MSERAAEDMLAPDHTSSDQASPDQASPDGTRERLLAEVAELLAHEQVGIGFLAAYYRLVAPEDLAAAGPERLAATAARHAALGATRPQGRPSVGVRPASGASLTGSGTVVDLVTDDMPYLVDSVTMALNRYAADIRLIVHPVLTVRRDGQRRRAARVVDPRRAQPGRRHRRPRRRPARRPR